MLPLPIHQPAKTLTKGATVTNVPQKTTLQRLATELLVFTLSHLLEATSMALLAETLQAAEIARSTLLAKTTKNAEKANALAPSSESATAMLASISCRARMTNLAVVFEALATPPLLGATVKKASKLPVSLSSSKPIGNCVTSKAAALTTVPNRVLVCRATPAVALALPRLPSHFLFFLNFDV